jgi:flagellar motor protein MotB
LEPISANDTESGRQLNRRVEVAIFANASARAARGN